MDEHMRSKQIVSDFKEMIDPDTGELVDMPIVNTVNFIAGDKDEFYLIYSKLISLIIEDDLSGPEIKVYAYLLKTFGVGVPIALIKSIKEDMSTLMKIKTSTIDNAISRLSSRPTPLIFRKDKSVYYLNPRFGLKGSSSERNKQMRILFQLGCKNC